MKQQAGYTLLELLVVLVIVGILAAAIPGVALPGFTVVRFSGKIQSIVYQLSSAHEKAIQTGQIITINQAELSGPDLTVAFSPSSSGIKFFSDGSATSSTVTIHYLGRVSRIVIDSVTGDAGVL